MLRLRMKVWVDPETGLHWLAPTAIKTNVHGAWGVYLMRDADTKLVSMTGEEWNTLPFFWFDMGPEAETRPGVRPWDMIK